MSEPLKVRNRKILEKIRANAKLCRNQNSDEMTKQGRTYNQTVRKTNTPRNNKPRGLF